MLLCAWQSIRVLSDHHADIYSIASHPQRPFVLVSTSRDTTMRTWFMDELVSALCLPLLLGAPPTSLVAPVDSEMGSAGLPRALCGEGARHPDPRAEHEGGVRGGERVQVVQQARVGGAGGVEHRRVERGLPLQRVCEVLRQWRGDLGEDLPPEIDEIVDQRLREGGGRGAGAGRSGGRGGDRGGLRAHARRQAGLGFCFFQFVTPLLPLFAERESRVEESLSGERVVSFFLFFVSCLYLSGSCFLLILFARRALCLYCCFHY